MADFAFGCPRCHSPLNSSLACLTCKIVFEYRDGIYRFLLSEREMELKPFLSQYERVRQHDGSAAHSTEHYRMLPFVSDKDPDVERWRIRCRSFENLLTFL